MMKRKVRRTYIVLTVLLALVLTLSLCVGAYSVSPGKIPSILAHAFGSDTSSDITAADVQVLLHLRLPRVLMSMLVGVALAVSGVTLQGIFRNPLVDSGLIGIASGASFFAALYILLGSSLPFLLNGNPSLMLAFAAFAGAGITTAVVYRIARFHQTIQITLLILAGVALNAIAGSLTGLMTYLASESELRDLTFWTLGSLGGATWEGIAILAPFVVIPAWLLFRLSGALNAFALGEQAAYFMGTDVRYVKRIVFIATTAMVGASVSFTGAIGFVGLVVPHILRSVTGPDHRTLLPLSALSGALLLCTSDLISRTVMIPTEVPVGIVTALFGTPALLMIILRKKKVLAV